MSKTTITVGLSQYRNAVASGPSQTFNVACKKGDPDATASRY
ncbi:MAG TPA: hypothetical protein VF074_01290 [Pyrinomonadaceae bacterium]